QIVKLEKTLEVYRNENQRLIHVEKENAEKRELLVVALDDLKCDRNSLLKQIEELESGRISQCVDLQRLKDENKELTEKIAAEKEKLLQDSEKNNNLVRELEKNVNDHLQGNQRLMDENRELRNVIAENDSQLIQFYNEINTMKAQLKELHNIHAYANVMNNQLIHVKTLLKSAMEKSASYKSQYDDLTSKIEPFKEQLEMYYAERNTLISMENESELKVKELFDQYANLLTHQNNKQKIRHVVKLKEENLKCRAEVATLKKELARSKAAVASYQNKIDHLQGKRRFDPKLAFRHNKENDDPCGD
uniref:Hyaluronan-mediated motility receptor C-terminal domain-containing protein n=1 Tax=Romanomermis culicivorax TaxID=13658 RepID=A0A915KVQ0_ROMCU